MHVLFMPVLWFRNTFHSSERSKLSQGAIVSANGLFLCALQFANIHAHNASIKMTDSCVSHLPDGPALYGLHRFWSVMGLQCDILSGARHRTMFLWSSDSATIVNVKKCSLRCPQGKPLLSAGTPIEDLRILPSFHLVNKTCPSTKMKIHKLLQ